MLPTWEMWSAYIVVLCCTLLSVSSGPSSSSSSSSITKNAAEVASTTATTSAFIDGSSGRNHYTHHFHRDFHYENEGVGSTNNNNNRGLFVTESSGSFSRSPFNYNEISRTLGRGNINSKESSSSDNFLQGLQDRTKSHISHFAHHKESNNNNNERIPRRNNRNANGISNGGYSRDSLFPPGSSLSSLPPVTSYDSLFSYSHYSYSSNFYNAENETSTALMFNGSSPAPPPPPPEKKAENVPPGSKYSLFQTIIIAWIASCLGLLTVLGNILVMVSFKIDKQLQTISNYFLFSLAVADFLIGTIGMPLSTVYLLVGHWPFGPRICDAWLAIDYLTSNASVLNLLMISFDRYFSVTRPLTYRAKRTTKRAALMISAAWFISLILWPPWIYAWPYIEGKRTVPEYKCYIQFIETNHYITFGTAIAAFYIPVSIMLILYYRIYMETEKRQRDLSQLQAGKKDSSRRSNSSDEAVDVEEWKRMRAESCICPDHLERASSCPVHSRQSVSQAIPAWCSKRWRCLTRLCQAFIGFCRVDRDVDDTEEGEEEHVSPGCGTPASVETPLQSSVSRCTSLNVIRDPLAQTPTRRNDSIVSPIQNTQAITHNNKDSATIPSEGSNGKLPASESVYTILIRIPGEMESNQKGSIRMIQEPGPLPPPPLPGQHQKVKLAGSAPDAKTLDSPASGSGSIARRPSSAVPPLNARVVPKPLASKGSAGTLSTASVAQTTTTQPRKKKKKNQEKKQEKKAAKTLSAILLAFIVTWTPYNILVLLKTIMVDDDAIPEGLWDAAYYLCYINSTINPMCYALCNASFRRTYIRILTCKWDNSRRQAINRGYYN